MSITPTLIGGSGSTSTGQTAITAAFTGSASAGDLIIVVGGCSGGKDLSGAITDSQSNGYTVATDGTTTADILNGSNAGLWMAYSFLTTGVTSLDSITMNLSGTTARTFYSIAKVTAGLITTSSPVDKVAATTGASSPASTGPTGTLSQTDNLVVGGVAWTASGAGATMTADSPYTLLDSESADAGSNHKFLAWEWQETSATTGVSMAPTLSSTGGWASVLVVFKAAGGGGGGGPTLHEMLMMGVGL